MPSLPAVGKAEAAAASAFLKEHYDLPDRRGDNTYRSWDEAYSLWQQESESDIETVKQHIKDKTYAEIAE